MTNAVTAAITERRERPPTAAEHIMAERNAKEFTSVLPTHLQDQQAQAWLRLTAGALKTGKFDADRKMFDLEIAALNNLPVFLQTCRRAASMGLQPGTEQFYFTTVRNNQNGNRAEILGIVGYKGYIELMYRGGHVASVIVETVHEGDQFDYVPGRDVMPIHHVDWMEKRGEMTLVYAYAKMHSGAVSKVVILNKFDIEDIKSKSSSFKFNPKRSPWTTDERAMWLKSAVRRLQTWVPWSVEIMGVGGVPILAPSAIGSVGSADSPSPTQIEAANTAAQITAGVAKLHTQDPEQVVEADEIVDAEVVPPDPEEVPPEESATADPGEPKMTKEQLRAIQTLFSKKGFTESPARHDFIAQVMPGVVVTNTNELTKGQARTIIDALEKLEVKPDVPSDGPAGK